MITVNTFDSTTFELDLTPSGLDEFAKQTLVEPEGFSRLAQRTLTEIEGNLFGVSSELVRGRAAVESATTHDAKMDAYLETGVRAIDEGLRKLNLDREGRLFLRGLRRLIVMAQEADALEDADIAQADARMAAAHTESKAGAGRIETVLVGRAR